MVTSPPTASPERAQWLHKVARAALVRARGASPTAATDHAAQALSDAQEALACIDVVEGRVPRASLEEIAIEARQIFTEAQGLINARRGGCQ